MKAKVFEVEGFGSVGEANLTACVTVNGKPWHDLGVGESCTVVMRRQFVKAPGKKRPREELRLTRLDDKDAV